MHACIRNRRSIESIAVRRLSFAFSPVLGSLFGRYARALSCHQQRELVPAKRVYACGSVMLIGSKASCSVASGKMPCSRHSSRIVLPV